MLLPTESRDKIGKNLAYPVGAETISRALEGIPQAARTSIRFSSQIGTWASEWNRILREGQQYALVQCSLEWDGENTGKLSEISWHIAVRPVLRDLKSAAGEALVSDGLPSLRAFMLRAATSEGRRQGIFLALMWSPDEKRVHCPSFD